MFERAAKKRKSQNKASSSDTPSQADVRVTPTRAGARIRANLPKASAAPKFETGSSSANPSRAGGISAETWAEIEKLLLPSSINKPKDADLQGTLKQGAEYLLQAFQRVILSQAFLAEASFEAEKAKEEVKELEAKLELANEAKRIALEELKAKLNAEGVKTKEAMAEAAALKERVGTLEEELLDVESDATLRGKAKMAYEVYFSGAGKEEAKAVIDKYLEFVGGIDDLKPEKPLVESTADSTEKDMVDAGPDGHAEAEVEAVVGTSKVDAAMAID